MFEKARNRTQGKDVEPTIPEQVMQMYEAVGKSGLAIFLKLIYERIACKDYRESFSPGTKIEIVTSPCTCLHRAPKCYNSVY